ncbi:IclR family transcriptional regulator [Pseudooceanicola sp. CBS1P-1]|nr:MULTISPECIES: IclR family transcriptional regulator [Pseudooceanicola]MBT9386018.1 IclR family transcriptional regulator [Pseudooceanicola endophyticus]
MEKDDKGGKSQVVERTCAILREVARHGPRGARLIDVTTGTGLSRPSAHRILGTLVSEQFVRRTRDRRYQLAPLMHELGLSAPSPVGNPEALRPLLQKLADDCGDTAYLALRQGDYGHYLLRCEGPYPIRTHVVGASQSRPLVSTHCGRSLLAAMPEEEAEDIIARASDDPALFLNATPDGLRDEIAFLRQRGFGWAQDVTFVGITGLTVPVPNPLGLSLLAISVSAISQRLSYARAMELLPLLQRTAEAVAQRVAEG